MVRAANVFAGYLACACFHAIGEGQYWKAACFGALSLLGIVVGGA